MFQAALVASHHKPLLKCYHYDNHQQFETHLCTFIDAYNYGQHLNTLHGLTPYEYICKCFQNEPERFIESLHHQNPEPNT